MKPEIKHITPYFAYNVKYAFRCAYDHENDYEDILDWQTEQTDLLLNNSEYFLLLHPLSDLTKEIEVNGERFVPWEVLRGIYDEFDINKDPEDLDDLLIISGQGHYDEITFDSINNAFQKLYSWHFDLHNLIKNGLAIDINTIK